ncbi:ABC transporter substrate-binding protein [Macrococcoides caseolyticum]|uniref:ABC transporter substrate-binding protein n=1 Tax=Macrococcoides caseolyticum TaxID=69966 RepID=UPI001F335B45|nr:ABC transporter substrate-binding protein [Macrococcus caseolyticus]MCE4957796.1 SgrR family transcriptional regulator [Macrococcus caseolyticus]
MIDKRLVYLQNYLSESLHMELHEYMNISKRQLSRLLNQWQDEGYIQYNAGLGRGRKADITLLVDAEKEVFSYAIEHAHQMTLEELQSYINLPWNTETNAIIVTSIMEEFDSKVQKGNVLLDYVYTIPEVISPCESIDAVSFQVIGQIGDCLYQYRNHSIERKLVKYDEWNDSTLHIYLHKDIYFDDGIQMTAEHVKASLDNIISCGNFENHFESIEQVEVANAFEIMIHCKQTTDHIKLLLAEPFTAIIRLEDGHMRGTGKYYIHSKDNNQIILRANPYPKRQPQVKQVYIVKSKTRYDKAFPSIEGRRYKKFCVSNALLMCNPDTELTLEERSIFSNILFYYFKQLMEEENQDLKWLTHTPAVNNTTYEFTKPIKFLVDEYNHHAFEKIFIKMKAQNNIDVTIVPIKHIDYLNNNINQFDVDYVWMMEAYKEEQPYQLYDLLTHCKFKEWYEKNIYCKNFLKSFDLNNKKALKKTAISFIEELNKNYYCINVYKKYKYYFYPSYIEYIDVDDYGYIDYGSAVVKG